MSKFNVRIAIIVLATTALSAAAYAAPSRGGGGHGGGGGRAAVSRSYARPSGGNLARSTSIGNRSAVTGNRAGAARFNVKLDPTVKSNAVRETLNSHLVEIFLTR